MTKQEDLKLLPCPFCGGDTFITEQCEIGGQWLPYVECNECGACSGAYDTKEEAIQAWNRRVK